MPLSRLSASIATAVRSGSGSAERNAQAVTSRQTARKPSGQEQTLNFIGDMKCPNRRAKSSPEISKTGFAGNRAYFAGAAAPVNNSTKAASFSGPVMKSSERM